MYFDVNHRVACKILNEHLLNVLIPEEDYDLKTSFRLNKVVRFVSINQFGEL